MIHRAAVAALALGLSIALVAGCGGDDPDEGKNANPQTREEGRAGKGYFERTVGSTQSALDLACMENLRAYRIELASDPKELTRTLKLHGQNVPFDLFARSKMVNDPRFLYCPTVHGQSASPPEDLIAQKHPEATDYTGPSGLRIDYSEKSRFPLLWDREGNHVGYRHVLFLDGRVEQVDEKDFPATVDHWLDALAEKQAGG